MRDSDDILTPDLSKTINSFFPVTPEVLDRQRKEGALFERWLHSGSEKTIEEWIRQRENMDLSDREVLAERRLANSTRRDERYLSILADAALPLLVAGLLLVCLYTHGWNVGCRTIVAVLIGIGCGITLSTIYKNSRKTLAICFVRWCSFAFVWIPFGIVNLVDHLRYTEPYRLWGPILAIVFVGILILFSVLSWVALGVRLRSRSNRWQPFSAFSVAATLGITALLLGQYYSNAHWILPGHRALLEHVRASPRDIIDGTELDDLSLKDLAAKLGQRKDVWLNLRGSAITDDGLVALQDMDIEVLFLGDTRITDDGLSHLSNMNFWILDLSNTKITDVGLKRLQSLGSRLRVLRLDNTNISAAAASLVREFTKRKVAVTTVGTLLTPSLLVSVKPHPRIASFDIN